MTRARLPATPAPSPERLPWTARLLGVALRPRGYEVRRRTPPPRMAQERAAFAATSAAIRVRHAAQTREIVAALRRTYERPVLGRVETWTLIERLARCIDPTDGALGCSSQLVHVLQVADAMEADGVNDPDLLVAALVHDLGKLLLLEGEMPENVVCMNGPIGDHAPEIGLDRVLLQWNHDEAAYMRLVGHVPEPVAWLVRYHSILLDDCAPLMDARDRTYAARYLTPFRHYDQDSKSPWKVPRRPLDHYRDLLETRLPRTLLF